MTAFAKGNTAGASAVMTSEAMKGADAEFGPDNVAAVVPVTDSVIVVGYAWNGVSGGSSEEDGGDTADAVGVAARGRWPTRSRPDRTGAVMPQTRRRIRSRKLSFPINLRLVRRETPWYALRGTS